MLKKLAMVLGSTMLLVGCATPKNAAEMRAQEQVSTRVCSDLSVAQAAEIVREKWSACWVKDYTQHIPGAGAISGKSPISIQTESDAGQTSVVAHHYNAAMDIKSVLLVADIRKTDVCNAEVSIRAGLPAWRSNGEKTRAWLEQPHAKPSGMACM